MLCVTDAKDRKPRVKIRFYQEAFSFGLKPRAHRRRPNTSKCVVQDPLDKNPLGFAPALIAMARRRVAYQAIYINRGFIGLCGNTHIASHRINFYPGRNVNQRTWLKCADARWPGL